MQNWKKSVLALLLTALLVPSTALPQDLTEARADSLVSYIELLEHDLTMCQIVADAKSDSLRVDLSIMGYRLEIAEKERARWYHDPRLWFLAGCVSATLVISQTLQISF